MIFRNSELKDLDKIFELYNEATLYQKKVTTKSWRGFERSQVIKEIDERRHYVILEGEEIVCTFVITYNDPIIWEDGATAPAIYIHRIATNPKYRGNSYVQKIVNWTKELAIAENRRLVRLDTHSGNDRINAYYVSCGFTYIGIRSIEWTPELPEHYKEGSFSLFELEV